MSITITPVGDTEFLKVTGDIERRFAVPAHPDDDDYVISLSDGTLLKGAFGDDQRHVIRVEVEGAGLVRHVENSVVVDWPVEWLTVASASLSARPEREPFCLPLFPPCAAA